ncbi:MAG: hypothetical protein KF746_05320 [Chitinophagaceae bacterium]|nr:hypothetical protein [Chitinophagaceae bacterium]
MIFVLPAVFVLETKPPTVELDLNSFLPPNRLLVENSMKASPFTLSVPDADFLQPENMNTTKKLDIISRLQMIKNIILIDLRGQIYYFILFEIHPYKNTIKSSAISLSARNCARGGSFQNPVAAYTHWQYHANSSNGADFLNSRIL